jgi:uncharacterized Tic20 family protein
MNAVEMEIEMRQPDIGLKVADLRQQLNLTQEQLAEYCEVSPRTIQRIENAEVEPRAFTRNNLSNALEFDFGQDNTENETVWLALLHVSSIFLVVLVPLLLWSWQKNKSYRIDQDGRKALNFQITMNLVLFAALCLMAFVLPAILILESELGTIPISLTIGLASLSLIPFLAVGIYAFFQGAINTARALSDKRVHYPLSIQFIK